VLAASVSFAPKTPFIVVSTAVSSTRVVDSILCYDMI
jgi:hypothetical protein